ncbi:unnamed protein product [Rotaria sp. Silwood1]|nr:unnamed protein product [Rotaria sp. Silwood1]
MATGISSTNLFYTKSDEMHLEIFCLVWLDAGSSAKDGRDTEQQLRSIINHLKKFQDVSQCQKYIHERSPKERVVMIVSGQLGREIVPFIHNLRQVISIYVYCFDKKRNEQWACKYAKVRAVVVELNELVFRIKADHKIQKMVEEPLSINIFTIGGDTGSSTTGLNGEFVFSQVLIDCLIRLRYTEADKKELIHLCKQQYKGNTVELSNVREFQDKYSPDKVLWWYSRESFFYKTLNAALRAPADIHTIFLFRNYITDIQHQLENHQAKDPVRVYRSQMISTNELETLKQCRGQFISVNSFFSTSIDKQLALSFLKVPHGTENLEAVLFQIDADPRMGITKPFADITEYSEYKDEAEVLFMLGSIFRLDSVNRSKHGQVWIIQMTLCNDDEHDLKQVLMDMKEQFVSEETNLQKLGKILLEMGKPDLAQQYFIRMLEQLLPNDPLRIDLYLDLGTLESYAGHLDKSMEWRQKASALKKQIQSTSSSISKQKNPIVIPNIPADARWAQNGETVAGGHGHGNATNQLSHPEGLFIDDDQTMVIVDNKNHRIIQWKMGATNGQVVAGGNSYGYRLDQLNDPTDVLIDKETDSLIICDRGNRRVVRWSHRSGTTEGEILIDNVLCWGLAMDDQRYLYISDIEKHEVRRYQIGDKNGTLVAGGNGIGAGFNQLNNPSYIFVDRQQTVYVSDNNNHRVMRWDKGAKEGIIVAGGQGSGESLKELRNPNELLVDTLGTIYVSDTNNERVMRWSKGAKQGTLIAGVNGYGEKADQLNSPRGLSFDRQGNIYVADMNNNRVQRFSIK